MDQIGLNLIQIDQTIFGSDWIKLDQVGSDWIGLDQVGLDWIRLDQIMT